MVKRYNTDLLPPFLLTDFYTKAELPLVRYELFSIFTLNQPSSGKYIVSRLVEAWISAGYSRSMRSIQSLLQRESKRPESVLRSVEEYLTIDALNRVHIEADLPRAKDNV